MQVRLVACSNTSNARGYYEISINYAALNSSASAVDAQADSDSAEDAHTQLDVALKVKAKHKEEFYSLLKELEECNRNYRPASTLDFQ